MASTAPVFWNITYSISPQLMQILLPRKSGGQKHCYRWGSMSNCGWKFKCTQSRHYWFCLTATKRVKKKSEGTLTILEFDMYEMKTVFACSLDVCGDLASSLLLGDVPEAAVPSGEGKRTEYVSISFVPHLSSPLHCSTAQLTVSWLTTNTLHTTTFPVLSWSPGWENSADHQ